MSNSVNAYGSFQVSTNVYLPFEQDQFRVHLTEVLRNHAQAINKREVGNYDTQVSPTGEQWPPESGNNSLRRRTTFRKLVQISINNASSPQSFAHGISDIEMVTHISAVVGNGSSWIPLPFPGADEVLVEVTSTNVVITSASSTWNNYTGFVVIEYIAKNN